MKHVILQNTDLRFTCIFHYDIVVINEGNSNEFHFGVRSKNFCSLKILFTLVRRIFVEEEMNYVSGSGSR